ncbi:hypothetical protein [Magnetococcus sp. PR-3]|uniref:hypothetical protein n=1 Tax=Magnetococcus sp. PR-3 TaxID=3120355 RepID=UPI002FCE1886
MKLEIEAQRDEQNDLWITTCTLFPKLRITGHSDTELRKKWHQAIIPLLIKRQQEAQQSSSMSNATKLRDWDMARKKARPRACRAGQNRLAASEAKRPTQDPVYELIIHYQ